MNTELAFVVLGHENKNPLLEVTRCLGANPCYWHESRLLRMGQETGLMARISGSWDVVAKIELALENLEKKSGFRCLVTRTGPRVSEEPLYPYNVQIIAPNSPGHAVTTVQFFFDQGVTIEDMLIDPYTTPHQTAMLAFGFHISVPSSVSISELRERFLLLCDHHNMDGIMEPVKN